MDMKNSNLIKIGSLDLLKFKFEHGVFDLKDLVMLVQGELITKEDFVDITRLHYDSINEKNGHYA